MINSEEEMRARLILNESGKLVSKVTKVACTNKSVEKEKIMLALDDIEKKIKYLEIKAEIDKEKISVEDVLAVGATGVAAVIADPLLVVKVPFNIALDILDL